MRFRGILPELKKWFANYPLYKMIALLLAVVVYLYVNHEFR